MNNLFIWDILKEGRIVSVGNIKAVCVVEGKLTLSDSYTAFYHVLEISACTETHNYSYKTLNRPST